MENLPEICPHKDLKPDSLIAVYCPALKIHLFWEWRQNEEDIFPNGESVKTYLQGNWSKVGEHLYVYA